MNEAIILGIDIGGSSIKVAPINIVTSELAEPLLNVKLPELPGPDEVRVAILSAMEHFHWEGGKIGCTFPGVIQFKKIHTTANVDQRWKGVNLETYLNELSLCPCAAINDADAAGVAEMRFGAGKEYQQKGVVLLLTLGTGIGSALFVNGNLLNNTEFGHMEVNGVEAEKQASAAIKVKEGLSYQEWASRLQICLDAYERLIYPDLIILGGGISKDIEDFQDYIHVAAKMVPAHFFNQAGVIGAALYAAEELA
jgi:polyphosphate glucokinase